MSNSEYETVDLPGVGEIRARPGTSTAELAGAAHFWHSKYQTAFNSGFIGGVATTFMLALLSGAAYYLWS